MDVSKELANDTSKKSFMKHVFDIETESQKEMMNIIQYSLLALIPVLLLNKAVQTLFPEADESKSNMEIAMEVAGQTLVMFLGILFIHRLVTYVPTYSKMDYSPFKVTNVVIAFLSIVLSIQSRIGEKANILIDRFMSYFNGGAKKQPAVAKQGAPSPGGMMVHGNGPVSSGGMMPPNPMMSNQPVSQPGYGGNPMMNNTPNAANMGMQGDFGNGMGMGGYGLLDQGNGFDTILAANDGGMSWGAPF